MIERIVENWLTNANERSYQVPFCQCLVSQGYTVLHLSAHGEMEQGKDIICIDSNGIPCGFQLKSGDIDGSGFRKIKGEIDELVEIPINYPGIPKRVKHRAILVTNGTITDKVRRDIDDLNISYRRRGFGVLEVRTKLDILKDFIKVHGKFLPYEVPDFKLFLELLLSNGHALINKKLTAGFIEKILFTSRETKNQLKRKIASGLLLTQYVTEPFEKCENHVSIIEGWAIFAAYILATAERYKLPSKYWNQSYNLSLVKINQQLELMKEEFLSRKNYVESFWDGGLIYQSRLVITMGWLSAFELLQKKVNASYKMDQRIYEKIMSFQKDKLLWFWGESATPYFISMSILASEFKDKGLSNALINNLIAFLASENTPDKKGKSLPYPDPYYSPEQVLLSHYDFEKINNDSFSGISYHIGLLVDILVRRNNRDFLGFFWKQLSLLRKCEFHPTPSWRVLTWECNEGEQIEQFFDQPQSWGKLIAKATNMDALSLPRILVKNPFTLYFLLCYPHRLNQETLKLLGTTLSDM